MIKISNGYDFLRRCVYNLVTLLIIKARIEWCPLEESDSKEGQYWRLEQAYEGVESKVCRKEGDFIYREFKPLGKYRLIVHRVEQGKNRPYQGILR